MLERQFDATLTVRDTPVPCRSLLARTIPFALFMLFIGLDEGARFAAKQGLLTIRPDFLYYLYPVKAATVGAVLYLYRGGYYEICWRDLGKVRLTALTAAVGVATCVMWVCTDWTLPLGSRPEGFNPALFPQGAVRDLMTLTRVAGAVLVVPLMEELFWRSFLLRYLIRADFESVPLGRFTWSSFLITVLLFGLEHDLFYAGVLAGIVYNLLLYKTRSIAHCVLAHAVTNLALAAYVIYTGKWYFW